MMIEKDNEERTMSKPKTEDPIVQQSIGLPKSMWERLEVIRRPWDRNMSESMRRYFFEHMDEIERESGNGQ